MRALIAYLSYSGNTKEVAELVEDKLREEDVIVEVHRIGIDAPIDPEHYDYLFIGTFTWDMGRTPEEMKDFVLEIGYKPNNIVVFGSGDTQFGGDDMFCGAVDKLVRFYQSKWNGLKVEQSPRGSQEEKVQSWVEGVLYHAKSIA